MRLEDDPEGERQRHPEPHPWREETLRPEQREQLGLLCRYPLPQLQGPVEDL
jgi:hypothetical protein